MSANLIVSARNIDSSKVSFSEPRKNAKGGASVQIRYDGQPLQIRLPKMKFPGGVLIREDENTGKVDYKLMGSLTGCDPYNQARAGPEAGDVGNIYNFFHDLDEKIVDTAVANSSRWFGKQRGKEGVTDSYRPILTASTERQPDGSRVVNGKYPPSISLKFPVYDGQVKTSVIDSKGKPVYLTPDTFQEVFPKRVECNLVITPNVYIVNQSFGISWRIEYAQVFPSERLTAQNVFLDEDAPEDEGPKISASQAFAENPDDAPAPDSVPPPAPMPEPVASVPASRRKRAVA